MSQRFYLAGQVVEDISFRNPEPGEFNARLLESTASAFYKDGGFFVFPRLEPGDYTLELSGTNYQTRTVSVTLDDNQLIRQGGENELWVWGRGTPDKNLSFPITDIPRRIFENSPVLARDFVGKLTRPLGPGETMTADLETEWGDLQERPYRFVRDWSLRMKFNAWHRFRQPITTVVGRVTNQNDLALQGCRVSMVSLDQRAIRWEDAGGVDLAVERDFSRPRILGSSLDLQTFTDKNGSYILYPAVLAEAEQLTLSITSPDGSRTLRQVREINPGERNFAETVLDLTPSPAG